MPGNRWIDNITFEPFEACQCAGFICTHNARVANDIGGKDGGEPAFQDGAPFRARLTVTILQIYNSGALARRPALVPWLKADGRRLCASEGIAVVASC